MKPEYENMAASCFDFIKIQDMFSETFSRKENVLFINGFDEKNEPQKYYLVVPVGLTAKEKTFYWYGVKLFNITTLTRNFHNYVFFDAEYYSEDSYVLEIMLVAKAETVKVKHVWFSELYRWGYLYRREG